jgi:hypothetical protein
LTNNEQHKFNKRQGKTGTFFFLNVSKPPLFETSRKGAAGNLRPLNLIENEKREPETVSALAFL